MEGESFWITVGLYGVRAPEEAYAAFMNDDGVTTFTSRKAPDFTLPRSDFQSFSLRDVRGKPTILLFYPGDWEPVSVQQLRLLEEYLPELRRFGASLAAISVDSVWSHAALARELRLSFPLLSDLQPKGQISRTYRVYREEAGRSERALFLMDRTGTVRWGHKFPAKLNPGVHGILTALEALRGTQKAS